MMFRSMLETIGNTPLVRLERLSKSVLGDRHGNGMVLAKLENLNPGMSKKDRIALQIVQEGRKNGTLKPGQTIVELTSGNTGTGLAIVCGIMGHPFVAVMSEGNSIERAQMMKSFGARVELVPQGINSVKNQVSGADLELVEKRTEELVKELGAFRIDQFAREGNFSAHYLHTGVEIIQQTGKDFDGFVDFVGTGGTFAGCAARFKEDVPHVKNFIVEPACAPILKQKHEIKKVFDGDNKMNHKIQGGGYAMPNLLFIDESIRKGHVDGFLDIKDEEAIDMARRLAKEEGILSGFSGGANVAAAFKMIQLGHANTVVALICDSGVKYLSTDLFQ